MAQGRQAMNDLKRVYVLQMRKGTDHEEGVCWFNPDMLERRDVINGEELTQMGIKYIAGDYVWVHPVVDLAKLQGLHERY
eukprot:XP_001706226.1 Hypothetical protein GL50803_95126 [Giardia lamblia ATCC 50803]